MLTGDHPLTAVSIAHSSGLIDKSYVVILITSTKYEDINIRLNDIIDAEEKVKVCLVITGDALAMIQKPSSEAIRKMFLLAIKNSKCVICSRVSPKQKAELIIMVKRENPERTTLAIGDGANDVNMITSADVGIGIMGNEGQQAARASDYVIGQFSFLRRLLFVHGREAYRKNSFAVGYILWKNFLYVTPCIFLGFSSYFSGQLVFDPYLDMFYNILFTAYPIGWFATYDKELNYDKLEHDPMLYEIGMSNKHFNSFVFWRWYLYACTAGLIMYWQTSSILLWNINTENAMFDLWSIGTAIYWCIVFVVNLKLMIATNTHNIFSVILLFASMSAFIIVLAVFSNFISKEIFAQWDLFFKSPTFLLLMVLMIACCMLCEYAWRSIHFFVEEIIIKRTISFFNKHKHIGSVQSSKKIHYDSTHTSKTDLNEVFIVSSINSEQGQREIENKLLGESEIISDPNEKIIVHPLPNDVDQSVIFNYNRRCIYLF